MSTQSMLTRLIAPLALAVSVAGFAAKSEAAPYNPICGGGLCFNKDMKHYAWDRAYYYLSFNGSKVTHYNIRYREAGGREVQSEISTRPGSNATPVQAFKGYTGQRHTISVQACNRTKVIIGTIGGAVQFGTRTSCAPWRLITFTQV